MPRLFRTTNPALNSSTFERSRSLAIGDAMTLQGTVNKAGLLLVCVVASSAWTWGLARSAEPQAAAPWMIAGVFGGLIAAIATIFKPQWAPITAPVYALLEGLALGGISSLIDQAYHGIAIQAVGLTFATAAVMLAAYRTGLIRATRKFTIGVIAATGGIFLLYMVDIVMGFFGRHVALLNAATPLGIAVSVFIVAVAALNLILDFDLIERGIANGAPKYMEWYGAFGLMITLVWLYLEMLRLLAKIRER
jgi:uncharacterized YccA/Bax inhibitor family protein